MTGVRVQPEQLAEIEIGTPAEEDNPGRPEAMRRLVSWGTEAPLLK